MDLFNIPIFPDGALQGSVMIPIFIGVLLMTLITERFGWTFSGIVVPGYLVPILIVAPWSAAVIAVEAFLTILIVQLLTVNLFRAGLFPPFFGRDKFFLIVLVSVAVRMVLELWALEHLGEYIQEHFDSYFDYRNRFKAIGLVVVPLMANMVWKAGLLRGFMQVSLVTAGTMAIVLLLLVPFTNYSIGYFYYIYEVAALDFAASPKAYIIILLGAFLASRANLYLGWDFSGIMVPTLLALALLTPVRFVLTIAEAAVIVMVTHQLLKLGVMRRTTWEGPRLVCLMYGVSLLVKLATGHVVETLTPGFPYESLFAYGYLLSTLMAVKMHQKHIFARISLPVAAVSLTVLVCFHLLGQSVAGLDGTRLMVGDVDAMGAATEQLPAAGNSPFEVMQQERSRMLRPVRGSTMIELLPQESEQLRQLVRLIADLSEANTQFDAGLSWRAAMEVAAGLELELVRIDPGYYDDRPYVLLREGTGARRRLGWGSVLFRLGEAHRYVVLVPRPLDEPGSLEAGLAALKTVAGRALLMPGAHPLVGDDGRADMLRRPTVPANVMAGALSHYAALEVRLLEPGAGHQLWVGGALPPDLDLRELTGALDDLPVTFPPAPAPVENRMLRKVHRPFYLTLALQRDDVQRLLYARYRQEQAGRVEVAVPVEELSVRAELRDLIEALQEAPVVAGERPGVDQLVVWQQMVLGPLADLAGDGTTELVAGERLAPIRDVAAEHGYRLRLLRDLDGSRVVVLHEEPERNQALGLFAIRLGEVAPYHFIAPLPGTLHDTAGSAVALFAATGARALSIGPLGRPTPGEPVPDRRHRDEVAGLMQLAFQELHRASWSTGGLLGIEILGTDALPGTVEHGCLLRQSNRVGGLAGLDERAQSLLVALQDQGLEVLVHGGEAHQARFTISDNPQNLYAGRVDPVSHSALWLDRETRRILGRTMPPDNRRLALQGMGLEERQGDLRELLPAWLARAPELPPDRDLLLAWSEVGRELAAYQQDHNLIRLESLLILARERGMAVDLVHDRGSDTLHLLLGFATPAGLRQALCANLEPLDRGFTAVTDGDRRAAIGVYLGRRRALLQLSSGGDEEAVP